MSLDLPHDIGAERSVIGAVMLDNSAWHAVEGVTGYGDFYYQPHQFIFKAITSMIKRAEAIDIVTLSAELRAMGAYENVGGLQYLGEITDTIPTTAHVAQHAALVADLAVARKVVVDAERLAANARAGMRGNALADSAALLANVASSRSTQKRATVIKTMINNAFERIELRQKGVPVGGVETGFPAIDAILNPMKPGQVIVVGGRPSSGKTSMVTRWFVNAGYEWKQAELRGEPKKSGLFFSLETKEDDLADRMLCMTSAVNVSRMQRSAVEPDEFQRLNESGSALYNLPLYFDDGYELTIGDLRRKARNHKREHGLGIIVVDFLQLMVSDRESDASREREVANISRGLKSLAKELDVPIVALVQLNRGPEGRNVKDHRPKISDIRDSGSIEQDADVVAFMYRDAMYDDKADQLSAEFIIAKQKNGPTETAAVRFIRESTRFEDLSEVPRTERPSYDPYNEEQSDAAQ